MKIIQRFLTAICIILATCCVLNIKDILSETSQTFGSFDHYDLYEDFNVFEIDENLVFYNEDGTYKFSKTYPIKVDFNGSDNEYNLFVNNKPCDTIKSTAGSLYGVYGLSFYDINNQYICDFDLQIRYTFYASNFELLIETTCNSDELKYLNEYLNVNGFNLRIIEKVYYIAEEDVLSKVYASFYDENDTLLGVQNTLYNQTLSAPNYNVPDKTGYTFKGWTIDGNNVIDFSTYKFTKNVKLKPLYEINTNTVTFKNGSETISTQTVEYGNNATAPAVTPATGYTFAGWDKSLENITEDTTINATFNKIQYIISFYDCDQRNTSTQLGSSTFVIGDTVTYPFEAPKGYSFSGWSLDIYGLSCDISTSFVLDSLKITQLFNNGNARGLIAYCTANSYNLNWTDTYLTVRKNGSVLTSISSGYAVTPEDSITFEVASRTNYTYVVKINGIETSSKYIYVTEDTTITVEWTYVAPAKSWKTIGTNISCGIYSINIYSPNTGTVTVNGLKAGESVRVTLSSATTFYDDGQAQNTYSVTQTGNLSGNPIELSSKHGLTVVLSFTCVEDNVLSYSYTFNESTDFYLYGFTITLLEQYC